MKVLLLDGNAFSGTVPSELGQLTELVTLSLEDNMLTGRAPETLCSLRNTTLQLATVDCPSGSEGVVCPIPACCTRCRIIPEFDD